MTLRDESDSRFDVAAAYAASQWRQPWHISNGRASVRALDQRMIEIQAGSMTLRLDRYDSEVVYRALRMIFTDQTQ